MSKLTIRNVSDETIQKLSRIAVAHGQSVEDEARDILVRAVHQSTQKGLGTLITQEFETVGGVDLEFPQRSLSSARK